MDYYVKGGAAKAEEIKAAFEKLGIDVLDFGFADKTVVYCSIGGFGGCVQSLPYSINLMNILHSHPGYQELPLPVEPLFHAGDWLYHNTLGARPILVKDYSKTQGYKVECIRTTYYLQKGVVENEYHLWSISDAKDGDVLATDAIICIFKKLDKDGYYIISPCIYTVKDGLEVIDDENDSIGPCGLKPATKEDRELLFRKMREAGYEWDAEKKELRKTTGPNFKVGDWVAGIDDEGDVATEMIVSLSHNKVLLVDTDGCYTEYPITELSNFRLWAIAYAKDGDVLVSRSDNPFIYNGNIEFLSAGAYVGVSRDGRIRLDMFPSKAWTSIKDVKPATKEQRDLLFAKIREVGCQWDADKKELRKTIEPNFKVGDWVVRKDGTTFYGGNYVEQVKSVTGDEIGLSSGPLVPNCVIRLWTIQDAEDGDVLVSRIDNPFIYNGNIEFSSAGAYVGVSRNGIIRLDMFPSKAWTSVKDVKPATKEQRDLLFKKMKEAGYQWDVDKKELRKIHPHYDIANFHEGMPVLVRDRHTECWTYLLFSHVEKGVHSPFIAGGVDWKQCIPFNVHTKHLIGTTDMCPEEYINW